MGNDLYIIGVGIIKFCLCPAFLIPVTKTIACEVLARLP
jgi:hypothetical protein